MSGLDDIDSMVSGQQRADWKPVKKWLSENGSDVLISTLSMAAQQDLGSAVGNFVGWAGAKLKGVAGDRGAPYWQRSFDLAEAETVAATLSVSEEISGSALGNNTRTRHNKLELVSQDRRIGIGVRYDPVDDKPITVFLTEGSERHDEALRQFNELGVKSRVINVGVAQAARPTAKSPTSAAVDPRAWVPGKPVAHLGGAYGSLGVLVSFQPPGSQERIAGFMSASHVLTKLESATQEGIISSPVPPFVRRSLMSHRIGRLIDAPEIFHYSRSDEIDKVINPLDVALASISQRPAGIGNLVPDPNHGAISEHAEDGYAKLGPGWAEDGHLELTRPFDLGSTAAIRGLFMKNRVYKFGATTGLTAGAVEAFAVRSYRIKMPNNRNYLFGGLTMIKSLSTGRPFSAPGDSGASVYTEEGEVLGTVVGANADYTFVCPLQSAFLGLEDYDCRLETRNGFAGMP